MDCQLAHTSHSLRAPPRAAPSKMSDQRHALGRDAQHRIETVLHTSDGGLGKETMAVIVNAFEAPELASKSLGFVAFELKSDAADEGIELDHDDLVTFGRYIRHLKSQKRSKRRVRAAAHESKVRSSACMNARVRANVCAHCDALCPPSRR